MRHNPTVKHSHRDDIGLDSNPGSVKVGIISARRSWSWNHSAARQELSHDGWYAINEESWRIGPDLSFRLRLDSLPPLLATESPSVRDYASLAVSHTSSSPYFPKAHAGGRSMP